MKNTTLQVGIKLEAINIGLPHLIDCATRLLQKVEKKSPEWPLFPRLIVCMFLHAYYTNLQPLLNVNLSHSLAHSEVFATELLICESIPIVYSEFEIHWNLN